jgi:predicted transport protein
VRVILRYLEAKKLQREQTMSRVINETKFSFKAFRNLKKGLGEFDAVVECNEIAIREFLTNLKASQDQKQFIKDLANKHNVRVDSVNIDLFSSRIRLFYIMSVMQQAEQFIDEFRKEYKTYNPTWTNKADGETDFDNLLQNIFTSKVEGITEIGNEVYYGFEYYRFVRNRFKKVEQLMQKGHPICSLLQFQISFF